MAQPTRRRHEPLALHRQDARTRQGRERWTRRLTGSARRSSPGSSSASTQAGCSPCWCRSATGGPVRGRGEGARHERRDRWARRARRALCARVAGGNGDGGRRGVRRRLAPLHAAARARGVSHRDVEPQSRRWQPGPPHARQAPLERDRIIPARRRRAVLGLPPGFYRGAGRLLAPPLRRPPDQGLPPRRQGPPRAPAGRDPSPISGAAPGMRSI